MKTCITCRQDKPVYDFYRRTASGDGRAPLCKACHSDYQRKWTAENRERVREKHRVRSKRYVVRNRDARRESMRVYRKSNADKVKAYNDAYDARNPLVRQQISARRRMREKDLQCERIDIALLTAKLAEYGGLCAYCRERPCEEWDHVVPVSKGGPHTLGNLVPACVHCNHTKWAHPWPAPTPPVMVASPS